MKSEEDLTLAIAALLEEHARKRPVADVTSCRARESGGIAHPSCEGEQSKEQFLWHQARVVVDEVFVPLLQELLDYQQTARLAVVQAQSEQRAAVEKAQRDMQALRAQSASTRRAMGGG